MTFTILSIIAGIISAIPAILKRMDVAQKAHTDEAKQEARNDSHVLDLVLNGDPPRMQSGDPHASGTGLQQGGKAPD